MISATIAFRSVDRPHLTLDEDDVFLCPDCEDEGSAEYARVSAEWGECATCRGFRVLHGFSHGAYGLPVEVV